MSKLQDAVEICRLLETVSPVFGCHVALTGGTLYKDADRKDIDILFYRIRQVAEINQEGLFTVLEALGFDKPRGFGWCFKSEYKGHRLDMFFPEEQGGEYGTGLEPL